MAQCWAVAGGKDVMHGIKTWFPGGSHEHIEVLAGKVVYASPPFVNPIPILYNAMDVLHKAWKLKLMTTVALSSYLIGLRLHGSGDS